MYMIIYIYICIYVYMSKNDNACAYQHYSGDE